MLSVLIEKIIETDKNPIERVLSMKGKIYTFLSPVSYLLAMDSERLFAKFDGIYADGSLLVEAVCRLYKARIVRRSFDMTSMAPLVFEYADKNRSSVYIVASRETHVLKSVEILRLKYPHVNFVGSRSGYFTSRQEMEDEAKHIALVNPDFVIIGMGSVLQEDFLYKIKENGFTGIGFTCGGFIHQTAIGGIDYYPAWVNKMNIRYLYRMYREKHTRSRYLKTAFLFPIRFIMEKIKIGRRDGGGSSSKK